MGILYPPCDTSLLSEEPGQTPELLPAGTAGLGQLGSLMQASCGFCRRANNTCTGVFPLSEVHEPRMEDALALG